MDVLSFFIIVSVTSLASANVVDPEVFMTTAHLITSKGYPCEEHSVHTSDGYILGVQRIPHGRAPANSSVAKPVVLLQHGLLSSSACWVENFAKDSLGLMMADAGFDVWLGNSRGNTYSKQHATLSTHSKDFWKFTWDDMAKYDLPATVDYILQTTGVHQIFYVGHSQGSEIAFAQLSHDKILESKIKMFVALAPAVFLGDVKSPLKYLVPFVNNAQFLLTMFGDGEFLPSTSATRWLGKTFCSIPGISNLVCENIIFAIAGYNAQQMNASRIPVYVGQHPAGTSTQNILHYSQSISSKKFQMYDHGLLGNMVKYHQVHPPEYHLDDVRVPVLLYTGTNDWLVTPNDVGLLAPRIRNLVKHTVIPGWQHLDFMWAMNAPDVCYNDLISVLKSHV